MLAFYLKEDDQCFNLMKLKGLLFSCFFICSFNLVSQDSSFLKKLDWNIVQLSKEYSTSTNRPGAKLELQNKYKDILQIKDEVFEAMIIISPSVDSIKLLAKLKKICGSNPVRIFPKYEFGNITIPISKVFEVAKLQDINGIVGIPPSIRNVTEGLTLLNVDDLHNLGIEGECIRIGVISDGVGGNPFVSSNNALNDSNGLPGGELPGVSATLQGLNASGSQLHILDNQEVGNTAEGTAMLEIIHDLAPKSDLVFCQRNRNNVFLSDAIAALDNVGCDIIVDDVQNFCQSFYQTGIGGNGLIENSINNFYNNGGLYFSSVGNHDQKWISQDLNLDTDDYHQFEIGNSELNFTIPNGESLTIFFQWENQINNVIDDIDIEVYEDFNLSADVLVARGASNNCDIGLPYESITVTNNSNNFNDDYYFKITRTSGSSPNLNFRMIISRGWDYLDDKQYLAANGTSFGHPLFQNVIAVGAVSLDNNSLRNYSSHGPFDLFDASMTPLPRIYKPDICATDRVSVTGAWNFPSTFSGTSASAPHAAAIAGLLMASQPNLSNTKIRNLLEDNAVEFGPYSYNNQGKSNETGHGRIDALAAFSDIDNSQCTGLSFFQPTGYITDGSSSSAYSNYYYDYLNNQNCNWVINPNNVCSITLDVLNFDVSQGDFLRVYEGLTNSGTPTIITSSGTYVFNSGSVYIEWITDDIAWEETTNGCVFRNGRGWDLGYSSESCNATCALQNCFQYATTCNNSTYNVEVFVPSTIGAGFEVEVGSEVQVAIPGGNLFFDNGGVGYPLTSTVGGKLYEVANPTCEDGATIQPFPTFTHQIVDDCTNDQYFVNIVGSGDNEGSFFVNDGNDIQQYSIQNNILVFGPYASNQTVTFTIEMGADPTCSTIYDVTTPDCGNPPASCDITNAAWSNLDCIGSTVTIEFDGDAYTNYTVGEIKNEDDNDAPSQIVNGGSAGVIPFNNDGSGRVTFEIAHPTIPNCSVEIEVPNSSCNNNGGTGDNPSDCNDNGGVFSIYWPFPMQSTYTNSTCGGAGACGSMSYATTCGDGCGFHGGSDFYAQDWGRGGGICNNEFYSPLAGEVIFVHTACTASCGSSPNCGTTAYGNQVIIKSSNGNFAFRVSHLNTVSVSDGDFVSAGQLLGTIGNTGNSFGAHAHTVLYQNVNDPSGGTTFINRLETGVGAGVIQGDPANNFAADFEYNCDNSIEVLSFSTAGQCVSPGQIVGLAFKELGTAQMVIIELCDENGSNCNAVTGGNPFVLDNTVNQETWNLDWTVPSTPGNYTIKVYDPLNSSSNDVSDFSFEISSDCNGTVSCVAPPSVNIVDNNDGTVTVNWPSVTGATGYTIQAKLSSNTVWTTGGTNINITEFSPGAAPCTGYDIRVAANCLDGSQTDFTESSIVTNGCSGPSGTGGGIGSTSVGDCPGDNDDDEDPEFINCPTEPYLFNIDNSDNCVAAINWSIPAAVDNCNVSVRHISGPNAGDELPEGSYAVTYLAEDNNDNTETCTFTVIVQDGQILEFVNCPGTPYSFDLQKDNCTAFLNYSIPVATDNCNVTITQTFGPAPGTELGLGSYVAIFEATNNALPAESANCIVELEVVDNQPLEFANCPTEPYIFDLQPDGCTAIADWSIPVATDNCEVTVTHISGPMRGDNLIIGNYTVIYEAVNNNSPQESVQCSFDVQVVDMQVLEFINCPTAPLVFGTDPDQCDVYANWSIPVATDNCDVIISHISGPQPGDELPPATYTVTYQAVNNNNPPETTTCTFDVIILETQNPELNCPQDVWVENDLLVCEAAVDNIQLEFAFDNCPYVVTWASAPTDVTGTGTSATDNASGAIFPVGVTTVTYTITELDDFGNAIQSADCDLIVTVNDTEDPVLICPADAVIGTSMGGIDDCEGEYTWNHPDPEDNCEISTFTVTYTHPDGMVEGPVDLFAMQGASITKDFYKGVTTILYRAEDPYGNFTECTMTVEVLDDEDPMIFCDLVLATNTYTFNEQVDILPLVGTTVTIPVATNAAINDFNILSLIGEHSDVGTLNVTLTSPMGTTVTLFNGVCGGTMDFDIGLDDAAAAGIATAPCGALGAGGTYQPQSPLSAFNGEMSGGDWLLTFNSSFGGACGLLTGFEFEIIGNNLMPSGNRLQVQADAGACTYKMTGTAFDPPFSDNCPDPYIRHNAIMGPFDHTLQGSVFPLGETEVRWIVYDQSGNTDTCFLVIEVLDTQAPEFLNCPRECVVEAAGPGICEGYSNFSVPIADDNCDAVTVEQIDATGLSSGSLFPVGTTVMEWKATDGSGNMSNCTISVVINDTQAPTLECPEDKTTFTDPWECEAAVFGLEPTYSDNCFNSTSVVYQVVCPDDGTGIVVASGVSDASGEIFPKDSCRVTYRVADQPLLLITEVTQEIDILNGGMNPSPYTVITTDDYIEITNFGPSSLNIGGLQVERFGTAPDEIFTIPTNTFIAPGQTLVVHFGHGVDDPANLFFNLSCAVDISTGTPAGYVISYKGRAIDVAATNGFNPVGAATSSAITGADWSGSVASSAGRGGIYRKFEFDNHNASDFFLADVCNPITIGMMNPDMEAMLDNGTTTALQTVAPNVDECDFQITVIDRELPYCGEFEEQTYNNATNLGVPNSIMGGQVFRSVINVTDDFTVGEVILENINGTHPDLSDLIFKLVSPEGTRITLLGGLCPGQPGFNFTMDDSLASVVTAPCADLNAGGAYAPIDSLKSFYGESSLGDWTLEIADTTAINSGQLNGWTLILQEIQNYSQMDTTLNNDPDLCGAEFTWVHPRLIDNCCKGEIEVKYLLTNPPMAPIAGRSVVGGTANTQFFEVGETTIRYILTDGSGNIDSCEFKVTVLDVQDPVVTCPADIFINLGPGECRRQVCYEPVFTDDNCIVADTIMLPESCSFFEIGTTEVTITVLDSVGNSADCMFDVNIIEFVPPNGTLTCNDLIRISLDENCEVEVNADMILEGNNYHCYEDYEITVLFNNNEIPTSPIINENYLGQTLTVMVFDPDFGNTCWGTIIVEAKRIDIECPNDTIVYCNTPITPAYLGEPQLLTCAPDASFSHSDEVITFGNCESIIKEINRTWIATDNIGNYSECTQKITVIKAELVDIEFPKDVTWTCRQQMAFPNITEPTALHPCVYDADLTDMDIDVTLIPEADDNFDNPINDTSPLPGTPTAETDDLGANCNIQDLLDPASGLIGGSYNSRRNEYGYPAGAGVNANSAAGQLIRGLEDADILERTGSGVPVVAGLSIFTTGTCQFSYTYEDEIYLGCSGSYEILREWKVRDMCGSVGPDNPRKHIQVIKINDNEGPELVCPADYTISTNVAASNAHDVCEADYLFPALSYTEQCAHPDSVKFEVITRYGSVYGNGGIISGLPIGTHVVTYRASDDCENISECKFNLTVEDQNVPVAICREFTQVSLTSEENIVVSAKHFDEGSYDDCGPIFFKVRKMEAGTCDSTDIDKFNEVNHTRILRGDLLPDPQEWFDDEVAFCCQEVGDTVNVILRIYDRDPGTGAILTNQSSLAHFNPANHLDNEIWRPAAFLNQNHYNDCMVRVLVEDKNRPECYSPADFWTECGELPDNLDWDNDHLLDSLFGAATLFDNCGADIEYVSTTLNLDLCGVGNVVRQFRAIDGSDNRSVGSCRQTIMVNQVTSYAITLPDDFEDECNNVSNPDTIQYQENGCDLLAISMEEEDFNASLNGECRKMIRTYRIINWCEYDGISDPITINRDGNGDGRIDSGEYVSDGVRLTYSSDDRVWYQSSGYYEYKQHIKIFDNTAPILTDTLSTPFCGGDRDEDPCTGEIDILPRIEEFCSDITIKWDLDLNNDGNFELDGNDAISGRYPLGNHMVRFTVSDDCGNDSQIDIVFDIIDCKAPTPVCYNGLSIEIMPSGMVEIWASDFDASSFDYCHPFELRINRVTDMNGDGIITSDDNLDNAPPHDSIQFTCTDVTNGITHVQLWVGEQSNDNINNWDYCTTFIEVQDNQSHCDPTSRIAIQGTIKTELGEGIESVMVDLNQGQTIETQLNGSYSFNDLPRGGDHSITPILDSNVTNGVSTFDLALISKHVLNVQLLDSPYKIIAADANKSGSVTTLDIVAVRKVILRTVNSFPNNTSWRFVDKNHIFSDGRNPWSNPFPEVINFNNLSVDQLNTDFIGIKIGDVNGDVQANSNASIDNRSFNEFFELQVPDQQLLPGQKNRIEFRSNDDVIGFQFTLNYNSDLVDNLSVFGETIASEHFFHDSKSGSINFSWNGSMKLKEKTLFVIEIEVSKPTDVRELFQVMSNPVKAEAYTQAYERIGVTLNYSGAIANEFKLYQNSPNPFKASTVIEFYLPQAEKGVMTFSDLSGRIIKVIKGNFVEGVNTIEVGNNDLGSSGTFIYELKTTNHFATKRMILID